MPDETRETLLIRRAGKRMKKLTPGHWLKGADGRLYERTRSGKEKPIHECEVLRVLRERRFMCK